MQQCIDSFLLRLIYILLFNLALDSEKIKFQFMSKLV